MEVEHYILTSIVIILTSLNFRTRNVLNMISQNITADKKESYYSSEADPLIQQDDPLVIRITLLKQRTCCKVISFSGTIHLLDPRVLSYWLIGPGLHRRVLVLQ